MKILLIIPDFLAQEEPVGSQIVFMKLLSYFNCNEIVIMTVSGYKNMKACYMEPFKCYFINSFLFYPLIRKIFKKTIFRKFYYLFERNIYPSIYINRVESIIKNEKVSKIWIFACPETTFIALKIISKTNLPYHISVHDDMIENRYFKNKYSSKLSNDILKLLNNYTTCDLISPYMKNYYIEKYSICQDAFNLWAGYVDCQGSNEKPLLNSSIHNIAFIGSIGNIEEHIVLWNALESINNGRTSNNLIRIDYYIHEFNVKKLDFKFKFINYCGILPNDEITLALKKYDLLFLTMSFNPDWKIVSTVSFPSKVMSYLKSSIPFLAFAPEYSSIVKFLETYQIGLVISENNSKNLSIAIEEIDRNYTLRKKYSNNIIKLRNEELNLANAISNFKNTIYRL